MLALYNALPILQARLHIYIQVYDSIGMSKVLYVRGFNDKLHNKLDEQAREEGVSPASILENAFEEWLKNKQGIPAVHYLLLYSDDKSLLGFLKKIKDLIDNDWMKVTGGPQNHPGVKFLKKNGWYDATLSPYTQGIKNPEKYSSKLFDKLASVTENKHACFVGFMTEDIAHQHSLQKATEIENIYNSKRIGGVVFCPYDMKKLSNYSFSDMFSLFDKHDKVFALKENEVYEINVNKTNPAKLFL